MAEEVVGLVFRNTPGVINRRPGTEEGRAVSEIGEHLTKYSVG